MNAPSGGGVATTEEMVEALRREPRAVAEARRKPSEGGVPEAPGLYAWWMTPGAIPKVHGPKHPTEDLELLYVGIAPRDERSKATLRSRIRRQHLGGTIGSSTFRRSLAALLLDAEEWSTRWSGTRTQLPPEDNRRLSEWQEARLRLAWMEHSRPWTAERPVIAVMRPHSPRGQLLPRAARAANGASEEASSRLRPRPRG